MSGWHPTSDRLLAALADGEPRSLRQLVEETGLSSSAAGRGLYSLWRGGRVLRTVEPTYQFDRRFRGRGGVRQNVRGYHLYVLRLGRERSTSIGGRRFVVYQRRYLDKRGARKTSKASLVLLFLRRHGDRAFYSREVVEALRGRGVRPSDIMTNARRFRDKGLVFIRGYRSGERETPFPEGYLLTWIDQGKTREEAITEALRKTEAKLAGRAASNPVVHRIYRIRDEVLKATGMRQLVDFPFLVESLDCTEHEADQAVSRTMQLYPDIREIRIFNNYRFYYQDSMGQEDLRVATVLQENYIRRAKGRDQRVGHNWEACVEWFVDRFTQGARFWRQEHRAKMDPRRITIHLVKPVNGRWNTEVDRVWEVTPGFLSAPITYVLECKSGLIGREDVDKFLNVLRFSKDFGVDTPDGREIRNDVTAVLAGEAFNPKESVRTRDGGSISLAEYVGRLRIQLHTAARFNELLHDRGCEPYVTVQKVCRAARDEEEVRRIMEDVWSKPDKARAVLASTLEGNRELYEFEDLLASRMS